METIAKVLVLAIQHIANRNFESSEDEDIDMLERLGQLLQAVNLGERSALIAASNELGLHDWPEQVGLQQD